MTTIEVICVSTAIPIPTGGSWTHSLTTRLMTRDLALVDGGLQEPTRLSLPTSDAIKAPEQRSHPLASKC